MTPRLSAEYESLLMQPDDKLRDQTIQAVSATPETIREQDKIMLVLSYLGIFSLIPLLTVKDSDYVKWHAKNGLALFIAGLVAITLLGWIPFVGCAAGTGMMVLWVMGMVKALAGVRWRIPLVTDLAEKL